MAERVRKNRIEFCVTDEEKLLIKRKMETLKTKNMGAYLRKMAVDGYIIKVDYTEAKKQAAAISKVGANINHLCKRINSTGHFYDDDIAEIKELMKQIWQSLKSNQSEEL
jgi:hypothetical protein